ncbi:polysaccharide biosynthesis tyrosine autokinase [Sphingomonas sp.]|uniref:GumC family protein n=1 Tax=Sphingomonas sp. TaxID=28214 RepID=UPI002E313E3F|nr:polysaccharide biosynthesis tyrosine autokinase [Sphingomonas sp.]HEX4695437.1 polysaccharide biosynthesis tyrosine autokinase [Sphingomonas sp.]
MDSISPRMLGMVGDVQLLAGSTGTAARRNPPLRRLIRFASRWRWVLLGGVVAGMLIGLILTAMMTRQYSSTARLEISRETARVVTNIDSVERDTSIGDQEFYQTQYGLLQTKVLAERVARDLDAIDNRDFFKMFDRGDLFDGSAAEVNSPARRAKRVEIAGRILLNHVGVAPVRGSRLVDVTAVTPDPAWSQRIAQTWTKDFIDANLERRFEASDYARHFLEGRLEQLRGKLEESERQAVAYASSQGIINLPQVGNKDGTSTVGGDRSLLTDDITTLNAALAAAIADRIEAQNRLAASRQPGASSEALGNQAITDLRQKRAEAASEYAKLLAEFEPKYPPAQALASQIRVLDSAIGAEERRVQTSLQQGYAAALGRERALLARVAGLKGDLTNLRQRSIQYNIYQRDADTNRELYNALLQRYKEIGVAGGIENNNIAVVDAAKLPDRPSQPRLMINLLLAMLGGGLAGVILAIGLQQIDEGIGDPAEAQEKLGLPLLGTLPKVKSGSPLEALEDPRSSLVEAYLAVQANLELSTARGMPRSFAVTSTRPREGKSTTAIALAQSLARAHRKVVLVDADLRSPSVHSAFGVSADSGVSNFLAGNDNFDRSLHATSHEGLSVLPAGPPPPNAADLLTGDRLRELVEKLREKFDHVIVDSPPVIGLADAPLVASAVDAVVYVVEARSIQAGVVRTALARLASGHANVLGAVLTKFEAKRAHLGHGYGYGYEYGYGR